jgi:hypothetical protein
VLAMCVWFFIGSMGRSAEVLTLKSPDGQVLLRVQGGAQLTYSVGFRHATVVNPSKLGISIDGLNRRPPNNPFALSMK